MKLLLVQPFTSIIRFVPEKHSFLQRSPILWKCICLSNFKKETCMISSPRAHLQHSLRVLVRTMDR